MTAPKATKKRRVRKRFLSMAILWFFKNGSQGIKFTNGFLKIFDFDRFKAKILRGLKYN